MISSKAALTQKAYVSSPQKKSCAQPCSLKLLLIKEPNTVAEILNFSQKSSTQNIHVPKNEF